MRLKDVLQMVPVSKATWYNLLKEPNAPKTHRLRGVAFWEKSDIERWLRESLKIE
ncbi:helix-turn-helix transcriptional regulator [Rheinheimera aquimaris]|uniref:helix-turn-helix transcriptional regulator n=1 Tax=Rheinheimera aquimaris TaxID=412437 RepID=UPI0039B6EFB2